MVPIITHPSGREGDWFRTGFSPRKAKHSIYLIGGYCDRVTSTTSEEFQGRPGKDARDKSYLYINELVDVYLNALEQIA